MPPSDEQRERQIPGEDVAIVKQEAIAWLVRLQNSRLTSEDRVAFETWRAQSRTNARIFQKVSAVWEDPELHAAAAHRAPALSPVLPQRPSPLRRRMQPIAAMAACAFLLVMAGAYFDLPTRWQADHRTEVGERRTIALADGSMVTLNTQTAITLSFDGTVRHVRLLKGEALFKVRSDPRRPFIVESGESATRAVGTEFIVRGQERQDRVTVLEGAVEVSSMSDEKAATLVTAGSRVQVEGGRLDGPVPVDLGTASAWLHGRLVVDGVPLEEVIDEIRRYYPGTILLWNHDLGDMHVTGTYNLEDPFQSLSLLAKTFPTQMISLADRLVILF